MNETIKTAGKRYRIVRDAYCGFEVQTLVNRWWWPWPTWEQCSRRGLGTNTHYTIEGARKFAWNHATGGCPREPYIGEVVEEFQV